MDRILIELIILTGIIHIVDTLAYSVRLNSVKSGQVVLSFSLFNMVVLVSRTANTFQGPLIGKIVGYGLTHNIDPAGDLRFVIFAATGGTLLGILLIPTFLKVFQAAVKRLEEAGSVPSLVIEALQVNNIKRIVKSTVRPSRSMLQKLRYREIPKRFLLINIIVTGIYTIGVIAAQYSAVFVPAEDQLAAAAASGMVNGIAAILLTFFIDPKSAIVTDEALRGKRPYGDVKALVILLITTKLLGTLLGQVLFLPAAHMIALFF
ncbi:lipid II flippase Amj family protein [Dehalobacter sp. DCM]|uniref:lipid II flippase Amj family protein n=1 Tax=Dehalobacter sp. DCM TaxID=2907827 RepID=UPI003081BC2F|nr:lipid II flippase Amj family protein [Dehalobacter sp. DCM]